ncbi:MAG: beta-ketoacyl-[acyl-carrier-protein] synthase family protein [Bacteroidetes bacterium]|nr:MAG: beta-ketoacyl-[acyl-carrier-protein] synthase family protein [Bacteroidota bacterium]
MARRVVVTGIGILSSIGRNLPETLESVLRSRSGIGKLRYLNSPHQNEFPFAEVPFPNTALTELAQLSDSEGYSRNALLGLIAATEALQHARLHELPPLRTGLLSATTVGGMDTCERYYNDFLTNDSKNIYIDVYDCADSTEKIADHLSIRDYITTLSTACSSAANAILLGARLIRSGRLDRAVAGGTEALTSFHINGFNSLKILDKVPCRPFDVNRNGITLGEGAAYLILETEEAAHAGDRPIFAELSGFGNACEAFHQTASAPDGKGAYLAMERALKLNGTKPSEIDYINAHGTGTDNNDLAEGAAIERLFGEKIPLVSSTKPFTGHMTSAAGSAEAVLSILCLIHRMVLPNLNLETPMPELKFKPVTELIRDVDVNLVMSNSFGFGGNDTSLIFKKYNR